MGEDRWVYHNNTELKSHSLEYSHPFLPEIKNARLNIPLENAFTQFSGTTKASFTTCTWSKVQESTPRLM